MGDGDGGGGGEEEYISSMFQVCSTPPYTLFSIGINNFVPNTNPSLYIHSCKQVICTSLIWMLKILQHARVPPCITFQWETMQNRGARYPLYPLYTVISLRTVIPNKVLKTNLHPRVTTANVIQSLHENYYSPPDVPLATDKLITKPSWSSCSA